MNTETEKLLQEIEAREQKATPGKWEAYAGKLREGFITIIYELQSRPGKTLIRWGGFDGIDLKKSQIINNLQFIAHARTDIPLLVALVRRMERETQWVRVGDRMPGEGERVLVSAEGMRINIASHHPTCNCSQKWHGTSYIPAYWMPLPAAPASEEPV